MSHLNEPPSPQASRPHRLKSLLKFTALKAIQLPSQALKALRCLGRPGVAARRRSSGGFLGVLGFRVLGRLGFELLGFKGLGFRVEGLGFRL